MTDAVIDASALAYALIGTTSGAAQLRARLQSVECHAPHLIDAELGNVLRKRLRAGEVTAAHAGIALQAARDVVAVRYPHYGALAELAWTWRENLSFYDALYVALATRLGTPLITGDRRLSKAPSLFCQIEVI